MKVINRINNINMKSILNLLLFAGLLIFSACDKDLVDNPTYKKPNTFALQTPEFAKTSVDLKEVKDGMKFSWDAADYGFPAAIEYGIQMSTTDKWDRIASKVEDTNPVPANYANVGKATASLSTTLAAADVAKVLQQLQRYTASSVPATQKVYTRAYALLNGDSVFSNTLELTVKPYYVALVDAPVKIWYLVGSNFGEGKWQTDVVPLLPMGDQVYDKRTGQGIISWTGYIYKDLEFKLRENAENWSEGQWGQLNGAFVKKDGGNIKVPEDGYYTVTLDTKNDKLTIEKYKGASSVKEFEHMYMPGTYSTWTPTQSTKMDPLNKSVNNNGAEIKLKNHDWSATVTFKANAGKDEGAKFAVDDSWSSNWGGATFPYGSGGGNNIPYKAGTYKVFFNDITGQYSFVKQ